MEFASLEVKKTSILLQLTHPGTKDPLWASPPVLDPEGNVLEEGDPVGVYIYSTDSEPYQRRKKELLARRIQDAERRKATRPTPEMIMSEELLTIAACIDRFHNVDLDGTPIGEDRTRFIPFLQRFSWAKEQIDRGMADRSLFLEASPKT